MAHNYIKTKYAFPSRYADHKGMTIRQAYIMAAMQGLCANPNIVKDVFEALPDDHIANLSEQIADKCLEKANV